VGFDGQQPGTPSFFEIVAALDKLNNTVAIRPLLTGGRW